MRLCPRASLLAFALAACSGAAAAARRGDPLGFRRRLPTPTDYPIQGIDVSKYQGNIDWNAVKNSGVKFAWIKATEGGDHARREIPGQLGGRQSGRHPAAPITSSIGAARRARKSRWFEQNVPVEDGRAAAGARRRGDSESKTCHRHLEQQAIADMKVMLEEMERHFGKQPVIYTSVDFYEAILSDGAFSDYPMWVRSTKHHPSVRYGSRPWNFWQYQADGSVPGHRRPRRSQRLLRLEGGVGRLSPRAERADPRRATGPLAAARCLPGASAATRRGAAGRARTR